MDKLSWGVAMGLMMASTPGLAQVKPDSEKLIEAVRSGDGAAVDALVTSGGSRLVNIRGFDGSTPLTAAVRNRARNYVLFLLAHGADANLGDKDGNTPLITSVLYGWFDGAEALLERGADVNAANRGGETALIVAVNAKNPRLVRRLMEAGANPDVADHLAGYSARDYAKRESRTPELLRLIDTVKKKTP